MNTRVILFLVLSAIAALPGCGREVPEGYAEITVRSPQRGSSLMSVFGGPRTSMTQLTCPESTAVLEVEGPPGSFPPIRLPVPLGATFLEDFLVQGLGGADVGLLVPKGPDRKFTVLGMAFSSDCAYAQPIFGHLPPLSVDRSMIVEIPTALWAQPPGILAMAQANPNLGQTGFKDLVLSVPGLSTAISHVYVDIFDQATGFKLNRGAGISSAVSFTASSAASSVYLSPLFPQRLYRIRFTFTPVSVAPVPLPYEFLCGTFLSTGTNVPSCLVPAPAAISPVVL